ncbi:MAG: ArnT family glycosyltransferase, partial [Thermoflexales bacterium]
LLLERAGSLLGRPQRWALAGLVVAGSLALQWFVTMATEPAVLAGLARRTFSWATGGYWTVGAGVTDVREFLAQYVERAPSYPVHVSRHPPALALIFTLGTALFSLLPGAAETVAGWLRPHSCLSWLRTDAPAPMVAGAALGMAVEVLAAMAAMLPLFVWVRRLAGERAAAWAVALYPLMPGFSMWVSQFDRGVALATPAVLYCCERWVAERRLRFAFLAGLSFSVATFVTFGAVPIALMAVIYTLLRGWQLRPGWSMDMLRAWVAAGLVALLGSTTIWAAAYGWAGLDVFALYRVVFASHLSIEFPFWPFVFWHPWDMLTMIGLPIGVVALLASWQRALPLGAAFTITLVMLSLAHVARAETGRVWMYFGPLGVAAAAVVCTGWPRRARAVLLALLGLQLAVQASVLRVLVDYGYMPESLPSAAIPPDAIAVDTRFGADGHIALLAYQLPTLERGREGHIVLFWQRMSERPIPTAYKGFVHVATDESDQTRVAQHDEMPMRSQFPTTCWQLGQVVRDEMPLRVASDAAPGAYPVFVGLYDYWTGQRPPTFASPPARQLHGSVLLPTMAVVR